MNRAPVKSSNIKSVGYDPATQTMELEFSSGEVHQYAGVPAAKHEAMLKAPSIGKYFHRQVRRSHKSKKIS